VEVFKQRNFAADFGDTVRYCAYLLNGYVLQLHAFGDQISHFTASENLSASYQVCE